MAQRTGKVLYNLSQGLSESQKSVARTNIGAASNSDITLATAPLIGYIDNLTHYSVHELDRTINTLNMDDILITDEDLDIVISYYYDNSASLRLIWKPLTNTTEKMYIWYLTGYFGWANVTTEQPQGIPAQFTNSTGQYQKLKFIKGAGAMLHEYEFLHDSVNEYIYYRKTAGFSYTK